MFDSAKVDFGLTVKMTHLKNALKIFGVYSKPMDCRFAKSHKRAIRSKLVAVNWKKPYGLLHLPLVGEGLLVMAKQTIQRCNRLIFNHIDK